MLQCPTGPFSHRCGNCCQHANQDRLACALAGIINLLDPEPIVLGGGMSNLPNLASAASALLPRYVFSDTVQTRVVPNLHGDSGGMLGAAWLWP